MYDFSDAAGFIFDCDGTLVDSLDVWDEAEADLVRQAGHLTEDQMDEIHAVPFDECARIFHEQYGVGESTQAVWEHLEGRLMRYYRDEACALPGVPEFLEKLHGMGIPCTVVSSSPQRYINAALDRLGLSDCFVKVVSTEDTRTSKQDPTIYRVAMEAMGSTLQNTWAVDDAPYAIKVMHELGLKTIAPVNGAGPDRVARYAGNADIVVETLEELV